MNEPTTPDVPSGDAGAPKAPRDNDRPNPGPRDADRPSSGASTRPAPGSSQPGPGSGRADAGRDEPSAAKAAAAAGATTNGTTSERGAGQSEGGTGRSGGDGDQPARSGGGRKRRRRGGRGRGSSGGGGAGTTSAGGGGADGSGDRSAPASGSDPTGPKTAAPERGSSAEPEELPKPAREGRASPADAERGLVRTPEVERAGSPSGAAGAGDAGVPAKPRIGDTRPAPAPAPGADASRGGGKADGGGGSDQGQGRSRKRRRRGGRGRSGGKGSAKVARGREPEGVRSGVANPVTALTGGEAIELDDDVLEERRGRTRHGKPVGRYLMAVHAQDGATQIAILEGRSLIEHYLARPSDDITQIHGNIYLGRVQNVLPGMEAAFVDIGTPKNAVLYRGDLHFDAEDIEVRDDARIEQLLQPRQTILCQVTKNPIMHKGARLTQEVSLPGRFVVLVPNSRTVGISKRLGDAERKRLRKIVDRARPEGHGVIVRTAAESITAAEIERDLARLVAQWEKIDALAKKASAPALLYREPDMALRVIREEFSKDFRSVVIDDRAIFEDVHDYVASVSPALAERVSFYDAESEELPLFERHRVVEQLQRALDRKVWLPSGGSLIIEHTEALTVIDVNTGKNVGRSSLEETVFANNLEAAVEIARQLRLRDVGGIIVIDFVDMEVKKNRAEVVRVFREALARDKTRTQVFDISELGLVQMTRKRIGEGLLESFSSPCPTCEGRGVQLDQSLLG